MADESKTEQPTQRHREKAREKGQVPRSRELSSALALMACLAVLSSHVSSSVLGWQEFTRSVWEYGATHDLTMCWPLLRATALQAIDWILLPMLAAWGMAVLASLVQGGIVIAPEALQPKLDRLSPASKMKQLVSLTEVSQILRALIPASAIVWICCGIIEREWPHLLEANSTGLHPYFSWLCSVLSEVTWKSALVMAIWSAADYMLIRQKGESDLKMSKQEVREEMKQTEGNPQIKGQIRRLQRQVRRKQMLKNVERATVVVVNPTHFAVALEYGPMLAAPVVVAKGQNLLAEQIKQAARWNNIPIMENPPLARALYRMAEVGQMIPSKLYNAVAEILAFVYRMQAQAARRRPAHA
jgi:flagellar biosynthetic protein FlhB